MREHDIRPKALLDEFFALMNADAQRLAARRDQFVEVPCPGCGTPGGTTVFEKEGFPYRLCGECGSLFASPRPAVAALIDYALHSRAVEYWSTHFYRQTADARRTKIFRPRAAAVAALADAHGVPATGSFVDIGAGYGLFLEEARQTGRFGTVSGIEPDRRLAQVCRESGFAVNETWVEDLASGAIDADMASAFEVLEHTFEPLQFLTACARVVRPGGILLFTTLTISGFDLQSLWRESRQISPPQHLNFLSVDGIARLVERAGLTLLDLATPGQLDVDIVRNALVEQPNLDVGRFSRTIAGASDETRQAFQEFLRAHRLSSHLRCVTQRPS